MPSPKILVIDDDPQIRMLFCQVLENEGFEVVQAVNGQEGLDLFGKQHFDLVITDLFMPDVDGLTVIATLKKQAPGVKMIGISGGPREKNSQLLPIGEDLDQVRILKKPIDIGLLVSEIYAVLKK